MKVLKFVWVKIIKSVAIFIWDMSIGQIILGIKNHGVIFGLLIGATAFTIMYLPQYLYEWTQLELMRKIWIWWMAVWSMPFPPLWLTSGLIATWLLGKLNKVDNHSKRIAKFINDIIDRNKDGTITIQEVGVFLQNIPNRTIRRLFKHKKEDKQNGAK